MSDIMKIRDKNPDLKNLIVSLEKASKKAPVWKAVAKNLNRPNRKSIEINVQDLNGQEGTIIVPGKVLGNGELSKPLTVAALNFTESAKSIIEKSGGKALTIQELLDKNPAGKKIRIIG